MQSKSNLAHTFIKSGFQVAEQNKSGWFPPKINTLFSYRRHFFMHIFCLILKWQKALMHKALVACADVYVWASYIWAARWLLALIKTHLSPHTSLQIRIHRYIPVNTRVHPSSAARWKVNCQTADPLSEILSLQSMTNFCERVQL